MNFIDQIRKTIDRHSMLSGNDRLLIGLSGGPDSVCLCLVLNELKNEYGLTLSAVYIDHGLRPDETVNEAEFCRRFCDEHQIDFIKKSVDAGGHAQLNGMNLQEAARELRYKVYEETAQSINASAIALGHNADDQAETVLMRLIRGSGRKGLSGIPPVRSSIIRPLIETERRDIEGYLSGRPYMIDSSNLKDKYSRNWIRLSLMNEIKKRNPSVVNDICRCAEILRDEDAYLELKVTKTLMRLITRKSDTFIQLFLSPLRTIEKPILRRVLRRSINETSGLRGISFTHIEDIIRLIKEGDAGDRLNLPDGIRVIMEYSTLKLTSEEPAQVGNYELDCPGDLVVNETRQVLRATFEEKNDDYGDGKYSVLLSADAMEFPLTIRHKKEGDSFYPIGFGKKKKLQDLFVDEKIVRDERDGVPIVLSGDDIVWVAGLRADDRFKVTDKTQKFLRLVLSRPKL